MSRSLVDRLREGALEKSQAAWRRLDGGQDLSIGSMLADEAADRIEALETALKPFAEAARNFSFAVAPDGLDDSLTVLAHIHVRPECEATLCTSHFSQAYKLLKDEATP